MMRSVGGGGLVVDWVIRDDYVVRAQGVQRSVAM